MAERIVPEEERFTPGEMQIEQEKLKLERERLMLERERLEAARERYATAGGLYADEKGKLRVKLSTTVMVTIIFTLLGGIMGALSTSSHLDRRSQVRLQEVMQTLTSATGEGLLESNELAEAEVALPKWLQVMNPQKAYSGVSVIVIQ